MVKVSNTTQVVMSFVDVATLTADASLTYANTLVSSIIEAGGFRYEVAASGASDHHITTAGGVKLYVEIPLSGLDPRALGAPANGTDDDAPFLEQCFELTHHVNLASEQTYRLASVVGLPDQSLYAAEAFQLSGNGASVILDGVAAGDAIFTSALAKASPESTSNLFAGKFDVSGIQWSQTSASVILNGDRIYNIFFHNNHVDSVTSVVKSYRPKTSSLTNGYIQSLTLAHNHFISVTKIVDAKRMFHFRWDHNYAEACGAGIYADGADDAAVISFSMIGGVFEGGGQAVRLGKVLSGSVRDMYFEANASGDTVTEKCDIQIGVGGQRSQGFTVDGCSFQPTTAQKADAAYYSIKDGAATSPNGSIAVTGCFTTGTRLYEVGKVLFHKGNGVGNGTTDAYWNTRAPLPAQNAAVSFETTFGNRALSAINDAGSLRVASVDVTEALTRLGQVAGAGSSGSINVDMRFKTAGAIVTGAAHAVFDYILMPAAVGVGLTPVADHYAAFTLRSFTQIAAGQAIETTFSNTTNAHFGTPAIDVLRVGNVYQIRLTTFTVSASFANYGPATNVDLSVTLEAHGRRVATFDAAPNIRPGL